MGVRDCHRRGARAVIRRSRGRASRAKAPSESLTTNPPRITTPLNAPPGKQEDGEKILDWIRTPHPSSLPARTCNEVGRKSTANDVEWRRSLLLEEMKRTGEARRGDWVLSDLILSRE